jgi:hypothetical protein
MPPISRRRRHFLNLAAKHRARADTESDFGVRHGHTKLAGGYEAIARMLGDLEEYSSSRSQVG